MDHPDFHRARFAANKHAELARLADAFGWPPEGAPLRPPPAFLAALGQEYTQASGNEPSSLREQVRERLFGALKDNARVNKDRLCGHDPERVLQCVDAMLDQYAACFYWDLCAHEARSRATGPEDAARFTERSARIEAVRAQIGPYYAAALMEDGFSQAEAVKIVGNAIRAHTELAFAFNASLVYVKPMKEDYHSPRHVIEAMGSHAQNMCKEPMGATRRG